MNNKIERMRYQPNKIGYNLILVAIAINVIYLFSVLNLLDFKIWIGVKIILNIFLMLFLFLSMEKTKAYSIKFSLSVLIVGCLMIFRICYVPLNLILDPNYHDTKKIIILISCLVIMATLLVISGIISYKKSKTLANYLKEQGDEPWAR